MPTILSMTFQKGARRVYYEDTGRRIITLVIIAAIVASGCQVYKMVVMGKANRHLAQAETVVKALGQSTGQMQKALEGAKNKHPDGYLSGFRPDELLKPLTEAQALLEQAERARHPKTKHQLANRIIAVSIKAGGISKSWQDELRLLDTALASFEQEPQKLAVMIREATEAAEKLEAEGYLPRNFREARAILDEAGKQRLLAISLTKTEYDGGSKPDYRRIYLICLDSKKAATDAKALILDVPKLRDSNSSRAAKLARDTYTANKNYKSARAAAASLEQYPRYRCLESVKQAKTKLSLIQPLIDKATKANSMQVQDFNNAAATLSQADGILAGIVAEFDHARNTHLQVRNALESIGSTSSSASSAISRAQSHISSYSYNWQTNAKTHLSTAESELDQGNLLRASDPITALAHYQRAESEANSAYSAVDTSSDDDDDWFSTSPGSSGGDLFDTDSGGGGLFDYDSGGGGSDGGSFDWGGSGGGGSFGGGGGEFGGPSGGEYGGPSGGEYGGGL